MAYIDSTADTIRATRKAILLSWGIVMLALSACIWVDTMAYAQDRTGGVNSTDMIGKVVKNQDGKILGTIKDLVINWRSGGYTEYAVLSSGGFLGLGDEYVAVPWGAVTLSDNKEHFVLNGKQEHPKDAHNFMMYRFYDRSSAAVLRAGRSASQSAPAMKGDIGSVSVAKTFSMQFSTEPEFHR